MFRRVVSWSVVLWCAAASAQTVDVPAGFAKQAGGDDFKALAQPGDAIDVHVYRSGDVELTTIAWQFVPEAATRAGLSTFEHALAQRTKPRGDKHVSYTVVFDRDPMLAEAFDLEGGQRVYHRRVYAVDPKGKAHLWWTICRGTPTTIGPCEEAQRTMKLEVPRALVLPALPPPPMPAVPTPAPPPSDAGKPWTIDVPAGYHELFTDAVEDMLAKARMFPRVDHVEGQLYRSPNDDMRMLASAMRMTREGDAPATLVEQMNFGITKGAAVTTVAGENLASEMTTKKLARRTLYAADGSYVYAYTVACVGPAELRGDCVRALATMRLAVTEQVSPASPEWTRDHNRSALGQLCIVLVIVVVPLGMMFWIAKNRHRLRRRARQPDDPGIC